MDQSQGYNLHHLTITLRGQALVLGKHAPLSARALRRARVPILWQGPELHGSAAHVPGSKPAAVQFPQGRVQGRVAHVLILSPPDKLLLRFRSTMGLKLEA